MSEEQLKAFPEKVKGDSSLQEKLRTEGDDPVGITKKAGSGISAEGLPRAQAEISEDELENVSGGIVRGELGYRKYLRND